MNFVKKKFIRYSEVVGGKTIVVPRLELHVYLNREDKFEDVFPVKSVRKIELAIEKILPNWLHKFTKGGKHLKNCPACKEMG